MEIKEWLEILREERQLRIEKTKSGTYIAMVIILPALITLYYFVLKREPIILPGTILQKAFAIVLYAIIAIGSLALVYFVACNYFEYKNIEEMVDRILSGDVKEEDFFSEYKKMRGFKPNNKNKSQKRRE